MSNDSDNSNAAPIAYGHEQTRTENNSAASGDAHLAPSETVPQNPSINPENAHTRMDANGDARVHVSRKPPPLNWLVIDQVIPRFVAAGLQIKLRTAQKYCLNGKLRCTLAVTDKNTFKYFIDPVSKNLFPEKGPKTRCQHMPYTICPGCIGSEKSTSTEFRSQRQ
jgi:hypothetical protein